MPASKMNTDSELISFGSIYFVIELVQSHYIVHTVHSSAIEVLIDIEHRYHNIKDYTTYSITVAGFQSIMEIGYEIEK